MRGGAGSGAAPASRARVTGPRGPGGPQAAASPRWPPSGLSRRRPCRPLRVLGRLALLPTRVPRRCVVVRPARIGRRRLVRVARAAGAGRGSVARGAAGHPPCPTTAPSAGAALAPPTRSTTPTAAARAQPAAASSRAARWPRRRRGALLGRVHLVADERRRQGRVRVVLHPEALGLQLEVEALLAHPLVEVEDRQHGRQVRIGDRRALTVEPMTWAIASATVAVADRLGDSPPSPSWMMPPRMLTIR